METTAILADRDGCVVDSRYDLVRWLGGTAEGSVYLTATRGAGAGKAAIKLIAADSPGAEARLAGWASAARLDHPRLLRVVQTGRSTLEGEPEGSQVVYVVTELADEVLAEILPERALTPDEAKDMLGPILGALAHLHSHGFVHGRLKPSNILVVADSLKLSADCAPIACGKAAALTPAPGVYDAPELSRGIISPAADVWSLGMTIAAALTQRTPAWERNSGFEPVVRPALPAPFESIVRGCLRLEAASRLTLPEIHDHLEGIEPARTAPAGLDPDFTPSPAHSSRWAPAWIAAAVFLGIAVTALILHSHQSPSPAPLAEQAPAAEQPTPAPPSTPASVLSQAAPAQPALAHKPSAAPSAHAREPQPDSSAPVPQNGAIVRRVMPSVPPDALETIRGKVVINVRVQVEANGNVSGAVSESPNASRYFNRLAVEAAQGWQFAPGQAPGVWMLHFVYRRGGINVIADQRSP